MDWLLPTSEYLLLPSNPQTDSRPGTAANTSTNSGGGGIDTFDVEDPAAIKVVKSQVFPLPGDEREAPQNQARPHQAILDPTGEFIVSSDLGADLLRVLRVNKETLEYTEAVCSIRAGAHIPVNQPNTNLNAYSRATSLPVGLAPGTPPSSNPETRRSSTLSPSSPTSCKASPSPTTTTRPSPSLRCTTPPPTVTPTPSQLAPQLLRSPSP